MVDVLSTVYHQPVSCQTVNQADDQSIEEQTWHLAQTAHPTSYTQGTFSSKLNLATTSAESLHICCLSGSYRHKTKWLIAGWYQSKLGPSENTGRQSRELGSGKHPFGILFHENIELQCGELAVQVCQASVIRTYHLYRDICHVDLELIRTDDWAHCYQLHIRIGFQDTREGISDQIYTLLHAPSPHKNEELGFGVFFKTRPLLGLLSHVEAINFESLVNGCLALSFRQLALRELQYLRDQDSATLQLRSGP